MSSPHSAKAAPRRHRPLRRSLFGSPCLVALLCLPMTLAACGETTPPPPPDVYTSRGVIRQLPANGAAKPEIFIQHEEIAEFRDQNGDVVGMESMAMPFPIDASATWNDLRVGDKIAFTFEMQWHGGHPLRLTEWQILSADTRLGFELAEEPSGESVSEDDAPDEATGAPETPEERADGP